MASLLPHELRSVFEAPSELSALKDYASKTFCEENIAFLEEVLSMKSSKSTSMVSPIIQKYIRPDSPCQVNLDSETRTRIMNLAKDPEVIKQLTLFDAAFEHVARLLTLDTLPKFRGQHPTMGHEEHVGPNSTYVVEPTGQVQTWFRGHLLRRKGFFSQWKPHTYMKKGSYLFEFRPGANHIKSSPLQTMVLDGSLVEPARTITGRDFSFILHLRDGKSLFFQASSKEEMEDWMDHLSGASQFKIQKSLRASASSASSMTFHTTSSRVSSSGSHNEAQSSSHSISSPQAGTMDEAELAKALPILSFLESFTDAVIVADHSSTILAFNSAAEKLFGYKADEIKGQRLPVLMPEPYKSRHDGYMFRHEKFGDEKLIGKTRDLKGERKGGEVFPLQISLGKLPLKGHYIATIRELGLDKDEDEVPK